MEHALFIGGLPDERRLADIFNSNFEILKDDFNVKR